MTVAISVPGGVHTGVDYCVVPADGRTMGRLIVGAKGMGKSRLMGRRFAFDDFCKGVPLVILDPVGGTINNLLDKIRRLPVREKAEAWQRVRYVNMYEADAGRVIPWPIYYPAYRGEPPSDQAERLPVVIERIYPELVGAPVMGMTSLEPFSLAAGTILAALGLGITEMPDLLASLPVWEPQLRMLEQERPEIVPVTQELRRLLYDRDGKNRELRLLTLKSKLSTLFVLRPHMRAMFGAATPGIDWQEVVQKRQAVLVDFRHVPSGPQKDFCLQWVYNSFMTFVRHRGDDPSARPVSFIIDEFLSLTGNRKEVNQRFIRELRELVQERMRSHKIWLTVATQELFELPEEVRNTVLSLGTLIFGQTSHEETALCLARRFYPYDPEWVRKYESQHSQVTVGYGRSRHFESVYQGEKTTEHTIQEQEKRNSRRFLDLQWGQVLVGVSEREGQYARDLQLVSLADLDPNEGVDDSTKPKVDRIRAVLMQRDGVSEAQITEEIKQRVSTVLAEASHLVTLADVPAETTLPSPADRQAESQAAAVPVPVPQASPGLPPQQSEPVARDGGVPDQGDSPAAAQQPSEARVALPQPPAGLSPLRQPRSRKPPRKKQ